MGNQEAAVKVRRTITRIMGGVLGIQVTLILQTGLQDRSIRWKDNP